ncbi:MAG: nitrite reductase [Azoarcus sp.]|jgi:WD40 repeat protein|nr:nitrite reductase [Azoarcus sp.]
MNKKTSVLALLCTALMLLSGIPPAWAANDDATALYRQHCALCHGIDRLGGIGPALLPDNLERLKKTAAADTVRDGRPATQMAGFAATLTPAQIATLVELIYQPSPTPPAWGKAEIIASRIEHAPVQSLPAHPKFDADPMNLFIVVESGDHAVSILDGDTFMPIHRFPSRYALHGGPKFSPDGRFVYFASRDGWISKFDIWNLTLVAEIRAGINARNVAVSADGRFVAVANYLPHTVVLLDDDLRLIDVLAAADASGNTSRVSAIYDAAPRKSFVAALKDVREAWEIAYDRAAADFLKPRRIPLDDVLDDFFFSQDYRLLFGASRGGQDGRATGQVIDLDTGRKIASLDLPGMPHLGSGITWARQGGTVMATPNFNKNLISVIDMHDWKTVRDIPTPGPGFFLRSHENSRYAWADSMMSRDGKDTLLVIDKESLEPVARLRPAPGKTLAHVEFTRNGRYVLASLWERRADGGAIIVFDADTLQEIERIPMDKPVGKYNVYNKLTRSEGTSH